MKLKHRVIVTGTLFLGMSVLFLVGILFASSREDAAETVKNVPKVEPPVGEEQDPDLQGEEGLERNRRLQQKVDHTNRDEALEKQPRGPEVKELAAQRGPKGRELSDDPQFKIPPEIIGEGLRVGDLRDGVGEEGRDPWKVWGSWVRQDHFYPDDAFWSADMDSILHAMATYPILSFDVGHRGTQLKASMFLGEQRTAFKPRRYQRDEVIQGDPYAGFDRHNAEIAGFHLDGLLGFRIAPPVVGRRVNLTYVWPVTTDTLRNTYFKDTYGNTCFYGKCYYCRKEEAACANGEVMEGSVTLWLPEWYELKTRRHPYQRTYRPNHKAKWETDDLYCNNYIISKSDSDYFYGLLEFTDSCIFDFLMGNADRHHYETYAKASKHGKLLHIDNGKSFGNPYHDEMSILAPLQQCCRVRQSTWDRLQELIHSEPSLSQRLDQSMRRDPAYPILTSLHLQAIDRRLDIIDKSIRDCFAAHGRDTVLCAKWPPDT
ncbi:Glycosaminoglycan xylosylkinase [Geodia barretti]|uniref:Glycosaminoglycan xylosylkinase n=1 Tax=Geodia barretti TaxID=519541 RepID=A0AA35TWT6_GEOBA|nr:Glycosaminoglycan xylosylkinase [Geodia barretti]